MDEDTVKRIGNEGIERTTLWQGSNARVAKCSSYRLSATKHPLNNLPINSPGRLRHPLLFPLLLNYSSPFSVCLRRQGHELVGNLRLSISFHLIQSPFVSLHLAARCFLYSRASPFLPSYPFLSGAHTPLSVRCLVLSLFVPASDNITHAAPSFSL